MDPSPAPSTPPRSAAEHDGEYAHVFKPTEFAPSPSSLLADSPSRRRYGPIAAEAAAVLRDWGKRWPSGGEDGNGGGEEWSGLQSFLNKPSLLHEVEESLVVIEALIGWLRMRSGGDSDGRRPDVTVVDLCCGKGVPSVLLSHLAARSSSSECCAPLRLVRRCVMTDKIVEGRGNKGGKDDGVDWSHVRRTNVDVKRVSEGGEDELFATVPIEVWGGTNIHADGFYDRLRSLVASEGGNDSGVLAVMGIHLCGMLSPRAVGLFNALGPDRAPFLCLAPCCLPRHARKKRNRAESGAPCRAVEGLKKEAASAETVSDGGESRSERDVAGDVISVDLYETDEERAARAEAVRLRNRAMRRNNGGGAHRCYVCSAPGHRARDCPTLPFDDGPERVRLLREAAAKLPCWKCGKLGHQKADCPSGQQSSRPELPRPPQVDLDVSRCREAEEPFHEYCKLLAGTAQRGKRGRAELRATSLEGPHKNCVVVGGGNSGKESLRDNWNRARKANYIVVCR